MMFRFLIFLSLLLSLGAFAKSTLKLGYLQYPPYIYKVDKKIVGTHVPRVKALEAKYGVRIELIEIPDGRSLEFIQSKKIDGFVGLAKSEKRSRFLHFTNEVILFANPMICSKNDFKLKSLKEFLDNFNQSDRLVVSRTSKAIDYFSKIKKKTILSFSSNYQSRAIKMLKQGRAEFAFIPDVTGNNTLHCKPLYKSKVPIPISIDKRNKELIETFSRK